MPRRQRRQPDEAYAFDQLVAHSEPPPDLGETFDQASLNIVLQEDTEYDGPTVNVRLVDVDVPVAIDTLPMRFGGAGTKVLSGGASAVPHRILPADPRRGALTIATTVVCRVAASQAECNDLTTCFRLAPAYGAIRFKFTDELWVRSDTTAATFSWVVETWTD